MTISGKSSCASSRRDQLERQPERLRPADLAADLLLALGRAGEPDAAALDPAAVAASGRARPSTSSSASARPSRAAGRRARPSGTSSRSVSSLRSTQHDVALAELGQVVGDRRAADAAADDHARARGRAAHAAAGIREPRLEARVARPPRSMRAKCSSRSRRSRSRARRRRPGRRPTSPRGSRTSRASAAARRRAAASARSPK